MTLKHYNLISTQFRKTNSSLSTRTKMTTFINVIYNNLQLAHMTLIQHLFILGTYVHFIVQFKARLPKQFS